MSKAYEKAEKAGVGAGSGDFAPTWNPEEIGDEIAGEIVSIDWNKKLQHGPALIISVDASDTWAPIMDGEPLEVPEDGIFQWILSTHPSQYFMEHKPQEGEWVKARFIDRMPVGKGNSMKEMAIKHGDDSDICGKAPKAKKKKKKKDKDKAKKKAKKKGAELA